jgi:hexosaminidase
VIAADTPAGLFNGAQTLRQLFDQWIGSPVRTDGPWTAAAVQITDYPRFGYRGSMLDVARSVLTPDEVKRYIDAIAQFKANTSHLHLADDQAWRPDARHRARAPRLLHQGRVPLDRRVRRFPVRHRRTGDRRPGPGERRARVDRAAQPDGQTKPMNNTADVGYSTLQAHSPVTYEFLSTVWSQLAEMTPGP